MALALYRKYRPKIFKEVVGQNHVKTTIQSELESGKVAHAYLFSGPRGLGKTTMARLLAKAVNCLKRQAGSSEPCNQCDACQEVLEGKSLDVIEIDAASHTGVDNVRENIISNSRFTPTSRKFKVFIIDEVHMLSLSAFNALLKTLEEPPAHAIFILATTEIHKVPQTIVSRCQHFEFRKVSDQEVITRLNSIISQEKVSVDKTILENIAYYVKGGLRDAESLLGQILSLGDKQITVEQAELVLPKSRFDLAIQFVDCLNKGEAAAAITLINNLVQDGIDLEKFSEEVIELLRKILLLKVGPQLGQYASGFNKDLEKKVENLTESMNQEFLLRSIEVMLVKKQELRYADILQLPLELAVIEITESNSSDNDDLDNDNQSGKTADQKAKPNLKPLSQTNIAKTKLPAAEVTKAVFSLNQIKSKWHEVLAKIKESNYSLASTLKIAKPLKLAADGTLEVSFGHKFHQQRLNDIRNKKVVEDILEEVYGQPLVLKTVLVPVGQIDGSIEFSKNSDQSLNNILESFGGRLVE